MHAAKKDWHKLMKMLQNQTKSQKKLNLYRILWKSVASIVKWLRANMNRHYKTLGLGLNENIISICQEVISHSFILKVSSSLTLKSQYNSVYKDSMIGVFQKSQEIEKTRQEFVKVGFCKLYLSMNFRIMRTF